MDTIHLCLNADTVATTPAVLLLKYDHIMIMIFGFSFVTGNHKGMNTFFTPHVYKINDFFHEMLNR